MEYDAQSALLNIEELMKFIINSQDLPQAVIIAIAKEVLTGCHNLLEEIE